MNSTIKVESAKYLDAQYIYRMFFYRYWNWRQGRTQILCRGGRGGGHIQDLVGGKMSLERGKNDLKPWLITLCTCLKFSLFSTPFTFVICYLNQQSSNKSFCHLHPNLGLRIVLLFYYAEGKLLRSREKPPFPDFLVLIFL